MPRTHKLGLKGEALTELSMDELGSVVGGELTQACVTTSIVCVSVRNCITEELTCLCTA